MTENLSGGGRLQIGIIALVFFGPLLFATWMYTTGRLQPAKSVNHGELLEPVVSLAEALPELTIPEVAGAPWRLVYVNSGECGNACRDALHRQRQIRLMLAAEKDRITRVFLHGAALPDKVFLDDQHAGLITISDKGLAELLSARRPRDVPDGGIYLIDPLDNLIMYFSP
ncbi:MAG: hypothetical protein ACR2Q3_03795, partial [Woeseiaceae bacterium]